MKTRRILVSLFLCICMVCGSACAMAQAYPCNLTMRLSTRTGPSTAYTEPGTFFANWQGKTVKVFSKAQGNGVWWVQVEFMNGGKLYRAYTGAKRVDLNIAYVPEEEIIGTGYVRLAGDVEGYYGPGEHYALLPTNVPWNASGSIIMAENGYVLFDFYDAGLNKQRRAWLPTDYLTIDWLYGQPSESLIPIPDGNQSGACYYLPENPRIWAQVITRGTNGQYSYVNLHIGNHSFNNLPVYMVGRYYGEFDAYNGGGSVTFLDDGLFVEYYFPDYGYSDVARLYP